MTSKVKIVFKGWTELSEAEKREFEIEKNKYINQDTFEKSRFGRQLNEEVRRVVGPTSEMNCPCCGR